MIQHAHLVTYGSATTTAALAGFDWHSIPLWISALCTVCGVAAQIYVAVSKVRMMKRYHETARPIDKRDRL